MKDKDLFKEVFSDKLKEHSVDVNPQLWSSISSQVGAGASAGTSGGTALGLGGKIILGVASLATLGTAAYFIAERGEEKVAQIEQADESVELVNKEQTKETFEAKNFEVIGDSVHTSIKEVTQEESIETSENTTAKDVGVEKSPVEEEHKAPLQTEQHEASTEQRQENKEESKELDSSESVTKKDEKVDVPPSYEIKQVIEKNIYTFTIEGDEFDAIEWDFGNSDYSTKAKAEYFFETPGPKTVKALIVKGDDVYEKEVRFTVEVAGQFTRIPNTFTPTNDGSNDTYFIESEGIKRANIRIVNQQQEVVFETEDVNFVWDGIGRDGRLVSEGTYHIIIIAEDTNGYPLNYHGTVTIFR